VVFGFFSFSLANEIKTTETYIYDSDAAVSSQVNQSFSLYIGDNLSGVSTPVKSVHVAMSGVYTGNGTLELQLDSDPTTSQIFTLPNVGGTPTPFEILYNDPSDTISPTSSGTYSYTLNIIPSGVTLYGLGVKSVMTHRYKPPTCGGYSPTGTLESSTFDTEITNGAAYNSLIWYGALGAGDVGRVQLQLATSNNAGGPWNYYGADCSLGTYYEPTASTTTEVGCPTIHNNNRYFRYKIRICSANDCVAAGATTPQVDDVVINWSP